MPPGPRGYPVLGNVLQLDLNNPVEKLAKWRKEFGDILTINLIGQDVVVVSERNNRQTRRFCEQIKTNGLVEKQCFKKSRLKT